MNAGMCGRVWEINSRDKKGLRVNLGEWILDVGNFKQKLPESEEIKKKKKGGEVSWECIVVLPESVL